MPNRPTALLRELAASGRYGNVVVVNRVRPGSALRSLVPSSQRRSGFFHAGPWPASRFRVDEPEHGPQRTVVEHPWPSGPLESRFLHRLVAATCMHSATTLWIADPMAARVLERLRRQPGLTTVFDCYDAWDLSPLIRGRYRQGAVRRGYMSAATSADVIFANTSFLVDRFTALGARRCVLLPNACSAPQPSHPASEPYVTYVGRIHERFDVFLGLAVAEALEREGGSATLQIAGPIEREPVCRSPESPPPRRRLSE